MLMNHKRSNNNRTDKLNPYDVRRLYLWIDGWRGDPANLDKHWKFVSKIPLPAFMKKWEISSVTRVTDNGICLDCNERRCNICSGCVLDIFDDVEKHICQRCICYSDKEQSIQGPLNNTGVSLHELVRKKQGCRKKKKEAL